VKSDNVEHGAAAAFDELQRKREAEQRKEKLARTKPRERKAAKVAKAQEAFDVTERKHDARTPRSRRNETNRQSCGGGTMPQGAATGEAGCCDTSAKKDGDCGGELERNSDLEFRNHAT
jgi:hypothetical protein